LPQIPTLSLHDALPILVASALRRIEFRLSLSLDWRDPRIREVLILFLPVTISIGIVNLDIFINAGFGSLVSSHAPAAINNAFRRSEEHTSELQSLAYLV